jgi:hypothetical protein
MAARAADSALGLDLIQAGMMQAMQGDASIANRSRDANPVDVGRNHLPIVCANRLLCMDNEKREESNP